MSFDRDSFLKGLIVGRQLRGRLASEWRPPEPPPAYLTFSSPSAFTLTVGTSSYKGWDGTLEWSADTTTWNTVSQGVAISSVNNVVYLRGTGNTYVNSGGSSSTKAIVLSGSKISCFGNIENILDYATAGSGNHPTMAESCYRYLFRNCTALVSAPDLPATTLVNSCYSGMFDGCSSLTDAPALPATTLADYCYCDMFYGCFSLVTAPALPATTLAINCYRSMFYSCSSLTDAPALPATTLAIVCYADMFGNCVSLVTAPALPATTLADYCYRSMFQGCRSLVAAPALPAATLGTECYKNMFNSCTSLKFSESQAGEYQYAYRIPTAGTGVTATDALLDMFEDTGGTFTGTPTINTTYYTTDPPVQ